MAAGVMWMVSLRDRSVYAFDMATGDPVPSEQFIDSRPTFQGIEGLWGDDQSLWLTDAGSTPSTVKSVWRYNNARQPGRDIQLDLGGNSGDRLDFTGNANPVGLWSDGATMWVADSLDARIYAYPVPDRQVRPRDLVSVNNVSDTRAVVRGGHRAADTQPTAAGSRRYRFTSSAPGQQRNHVRVIPTEATPVSC